jgi:hypothetical protein
MKKILIIVLFMLIGNALNKAQSFRKYIVYKKDSTINLVINLDIINSYHKTYENYNYLNINDTIIVYDTLKVKELNKKYKEFFYYNYNSTK